MPHAGSIHEQSCSRRAVEFAPFQTSDPPFWSTRHFLVLEVAFHQRASFFPRVSGTTVGAEDDRGKATLLAYSALLFRAFHAVFSQAPLKSLAQVLFLLIVNLITGAAETGSSQLHDWHALEWSVRFLLAGFVLRAASDALSKIWFAASLTHMAFAFPKQRMRDTRESDETLRPFCLLPDHLSLSSFLPLHADPSPARPPSFSLLVCGHRLP